MSGIAGIYYLNNRRVIPEELTLMIDSISHRGTDRSAYCQAGSVGFVHCMLHTTKESLHEKLPYTDSESGNIITADARVDNREELMSEFGLSNISQRIVPDSHLILKAYNKWGEDCAAKIIGDFAFAIWDLREQKIFCARDHMGVKPLYYFYSNDVFIFGSEIKSILNLGKVPQIVNEQRVLDYLVFYHSDHSATFYRNIKRLPGRHKLSVTPDTIKVQTYWDFTPKKEIRYGTDQEYANAFRERFEKAVACRLRSISPVGISLSGGLDSSSIACVASNQMKTNRSGTLYSFSSIFESLPEHVYNKADERMFMDAAIRKSGAEAHFIKNNEHGPLRGMDQSHYDEPMPYFNGYLLDQTLIAAQSRGVRILLNGTDGDTTVSHGYERLYDLGTWYRLFTLVTEAKALHRQNNLPFSLRKLLWKYSIRPSFPDNFVKLIKKLLKLREDRLHYGVTNLLIPDVARSVDWEARSQNLGNKISLCRKGRLPQYWSFISPSQQYIMEAIDSRGAQHPIEIRYPFWDRRLMEFCLALPLEQKLKDGLTRVILRRGMEKILPKVIEERAGKADLSPHFLMDFVRTAEPYVNQLLEKDSEINVYIQTDKIKKLWLTFKEHPYDNPEIAMDLYVFISLDLWLRRLHKGVDCLTD